MGLEVVLCIYIMSCPFHTFVKQNTASHTNSSFPFLRSFQTPIQTPLISCGQNRQQGQEYQVQGPTKFLSLNLLCHRMLHSCALTSVHIITTSDHWCNSTPH